MYSFILNIWYFFVGKPKVYKYEPPIEVFPEDLKFGLFQNGEYLYQYFVEEIVYFFWGDFLEGRPGRQIETYQEKILVATRWNQVEAGFEILINGIDWVIRWNQFYTWDQDWGDEMILAVESNMAFDFIYNMLFWYLVGFYYVFFLYWSNYVTFSKNPGDFGFFDVFHQTNDQFFDYDQQYGLSDFNFFEDGFHIIPSSHDSDYDSMSMHDADYEDVTSMEPADLCDHPSMESDFLLDLMFDARGYVHFDLYWSMLDVTEAHRWANFEWYKEKTDILNGFDSTSLITFFWWETPTYSTPSERYIWQFKESKEINRHPFYYVHPLEHYGGSVDPFIMLILTWDYEPWLEDNYNPVIMGEVLVEEFILGLQIEDTEFEEFVDEEEEENDYDYTEGDGYIIEENEVDQLVSMSIIREDLLFTIYDDVGNPSVRTWFPEIDWKFTYDDPAEWDWEDWEELYDEGSDSMFSDNDAVLEDEYLISVMSNDVYFGNLNYDVYGGGFLFGDINEDLLDVYSDYSTESYLFDLAEGALAYGRNEERLSDFSDFLDDFPYVPIDRLYRHVSIWEFGNSMDYILGEFLLDVFALSKEIYDCIKTSSFQINILYQGLCDLHNGKLPEYPIRWNFNTLYYEVYNLQTHMWVRLEDALRYLVFDLEVAYNSNRFLLGYSPELLLKWSVLPSKSIFVSVMVYLEWLLNFGAYEFLFSMYIFIYSFIYSFIDVWLSLGSGLYYYLLYKIKYKHLDALYLNFIDFLRGEFYSNFGGLELLIYDKDYVNDLFKARCAFRLDLETLSAEEEIYSSWWVRQGVIDLDFYAMQLNSYDPRNPIYYWYDRLEVMSYPDMALAGCGSVDMVEIVNSQYYLSARKMNPDYVTDVSFELLYQDFIIFAGSFERDPSQWVN